MSPIPEAKTGAPNIQDVFLNYARREKLPVTVHLLDGREPFGPSYLSGYERVSLRAHFVGREILRHQAHRDLRR